jgi:hypothetical protein
MHRSPTLLSALMLLALTACSEPPRPTVNLYQAVYTGDLDQLKRNIYWGTDVNQPDANGNFPLHVAAGAGRVAIARELADNGADLQAVNAAGRTPLQVALHDGKTQVARMLVERGAKLDPQAELVRLVRDGVSDRDSFEYLIRSGADPNGRDGNGNAPLHIAIGLDHLETVKRLLLNRADVNLPDAAGRMPLALALDNGREGADIVKVLEQHGALAGPEATPPEREEIQ